VLLFSLSTFLACIGYLQRARSTNKEKKETLGIYREQDPQTKKRKKYFDLRFLSNKHAAGQL
jgi:hypothetical protein